MSSKIALFTSFSQSKKHNDKSNLLEFDDPLEGQRNCKNKVKKPENAKKLARLQEKGNQSLLM